MGRDDNIAPYNPEKQKEIILNNTKSFSECQIEYAISATWWRQWCDFVNTEFKQLDYPKLGGGESTVNRRKQHLLKRIDRLKITLDDASIYSISFLGVNWVPNSDNSPFGPPSAHDGKFYSNFRPS
jgi:hypothetical protein